MSQSNKNVNKSNIFEFYNRPNLTSRMNFTNYPYSRRYNNFQFTKHNFHPRWSYRRGRRPYGPRHPPPERKNERSPSPFSGTEEYDLKKIQETSDMIKKRLMMPESEDFVDAPPVSIVNNEETEAENRSNRTENGTNSVRTNKKSIQYNVEEIQQKIVSHISNLSHGKKMNLICSTSSGYDVAIQQIQKQKRLELSKALRDMCSNHSVENSEVINAIIPDIGIRIEDLPLEVIQELSTTLNVNLDNGGFCSADETQIENDTNDLKIKQEVHIKSEDICDDSMEVSDNETHLNKISTCEDKDFVNIKEEIIESEEIIIKEEEIYDSMEISEHRCAENNFGNVSKYFENELVSVASQTDVCSLDSMNHQTVPDGQFRFDKKDINNLDDAVRAMLKIDEEILRLTKLRQSIFKKVQGTQCDNCAKKEKCAKKNNKNNQSTKKRKRGRNKTQNNVIEETRVEKNQVNQKKDAYYQKPLSFFISETILVMEIIENTLLAASETGKVFYLNMLDGNTLHTIDVSGAPIVTLRHWLPHKNIPHLLIGSSSKLHEFNFETKESIRSTELDDLIQCMEIAWSWVFIGTSSGNLLRFSLKQSKIEFEEKISEDSVMVLKAAREGARRVLLVGMKSAPVCVRDAMSGLHLRTMSGLITPTVYSLLLENSMVYCGTTSHDILVFSFHDGNLICKHEATNSKGVCCMKVVENLLFASCYNGNIYVYNVKTNEFVGVIEGPGGVIVSMEIFKNIVIVGTMKCNFKSVLIPEKMLEGAEV